MGTITWGGKTWSPTQKAALSAYLQKKGADPGLWAVQHPDAASAMGMVNPAAATAQASVAPEIAGLMSAQKTTDANALQQQTNAKGFAEALGKLYGRIPDLIGADYANAGALDSAYGKGFSDLSPVQDSQTQRDSELLSKLGFGHESIASVDKAIGGKGASDVLYALGGYIPATSLAREGAAFQAASRNLPATAGGIGQMTVAQIAQDATKAHNSLDDQIAAVRAKIPGLTLQAAQQMVSDTRAQDAIDVQREYLGLAKRKGVADITGYDPVTGIPTYGATATAAKATNTAAKAKAKAIGDRESAFTSAQRSVFGDVDQRYTTTDALARMTYARQHGMRLDETPAKVPTTDYVSAKKALFNEYKYLLKYGTRSGQFALKRRLNEMIDGALGSIGLSTPKQAVYQNGVWVDLKTRQPLQDQAAATAAWAGSRPSGKAKQSPRNRSVVTYGG